jgi:simple sugar transport system permease protein
MAVKESRFRFNRQLVLGVLATLLGLVMILPSLQIGGDVTTTITFEASTTGGMAVPTMAFMTLTSLVFIAAGVAAALTSQDEERSKYGAWALYGAAVFIIPAILVSAAAGERTNATTMLAESLRLATPIAIGGLAGLWCERSGVTNVAIEGMMLFGACFGFVTLFTLRQDYGTPTWVFVASVLSAVLVGGVVALLHAWLSITFKINQIVSGTVINILSVGLTSFIRRDYLLSTEAGTETLPNIAIPILKDIPIIGEPLFNNKPIFYLMFILLVVSHVVLFHSRWGLRVRAVGENPHAADTLGIKVNQIRWQAVFVGGLIAGLGGAWFSLETTGRFNDNMIGGRGFISLAALIFGKWTPSGLFGGALLFGFSDTLGTRLQALEVPVPSQFLQMVPYIVTIIVLAGLVGRAHPPKAIGEPYEKE